MKKLIIKEIKNGIYLLDEAGESTGYLVIGTHRACLIDTMNGNSDLGSEVKKLTNLPVTVINTHGHPDHIFGNIHFKSVKIHPADRKLALDFAHEKYGNNFPPFEDINYGDIIDLGGRTLRVYLLQGHTKGGILLLCPEERILFTGDSINHHLWMQLDHSTTIAQFAKNLESLMFLEKEADIILHGHSHDYDDISLMSALLEGVKEILEGKTQEDTDYHWFDGIAKYHPFTCPNEKHFQQEDHGICYNSSNVM